MVMKRRGFTLIELLVVLAVLALLLTIAAPRYVAHVERAREAALRTSLKVMRDAIDKFNGDQGRLPASLDELVDRSYLKSVPVDPITDKRDTWTTVSEAEYLASLAPAAAAAYAAASPASGSSGGTRVDNGIADVHSGAPGNAEDGTPYQQW
jgi:general secretion pathway protein G